MRYTGILVILVLFHCSRNDTSTMPQVVDYSGHYKVKPMNAMFKALTYLKLTDSTVSSWGLDTIVAEMVCSTDIYFPMLDTTVRVPDYHERFWDVLVVSGWDNAALDSAGLVELLPSDSVPDTAGLWFKRFADGDLDIYIVSAIDTMILTFTISYEPYAGPLPDPGWPTQTAADSTSIRARLEAQRDVYDCVPRVDTMPGFVQVTDLSQITGNWLNTEDITFNFCPDLFWRDFSISDSAFVEYEVDYRNVWPALTICLADSAAIDTMAVLQTVTLDSAEYISDTVFNYSEEPFRNPILYFRSDGTLAGWLLFEIKGDTLCVCEWVFSSHKYAQYWVKTQKSLPRENALPLVVSRSEYLWLRDTHCN